MEQGMVGGRGVSGFPCALWAYHPSSTSCSLTQQLFELHHLGVFNGSFITKAQLIKSLALGG